MILKFIIALILPFILVALISRISLNIWVGLIASLGILMAAFNGAHQPISVILLGVVSGLAGAWFGSRLIERKNRTQ
ncbi:DUF2198 family protein [Aneurinibacillus sp. Ricciae_BoGa-3]|uniref:DUF2198 family protein n=1 Tax=Aneurinibacillus sp. Ricciae_BoGa-3 TaxID=3022697 RepID=UPI0023407372|nr:DUF2198 family protein [Aneurinibacillus sp. Ricciae_BoGa-3]WCK54146.1 DUF2198 family protein [Aneurinibacillus sp. Ricciae_BoGa-3]